MQYEKVALELRHHVGVDHIMFATDFPHIECEYPNSKAVVEEIYANIPVEDRDKIWAQNTLDYFKLDAA